MVTPVGRDIITPTIVVPLFALTVWACTATTFSSGGSGTTNTTADSGAPSDSDAASQTDPTRPAWKFGTSADEKAFCELYSKAVCITSAVVEASRLEDCTRKMPCYRSVFEADFLERQRKCLEEKLSCSRPGIDECDELAGKTYSAGASVTAACEQRRASCKQAGSKLDLACNALAGLTAAARQKTEECLDPSNACRDIVPCMTSSYGGACASL